MKFFPQHNSFHLPLKFFLFFKVAKNEKDFSIYVNCLAGMKAMVILATAYYQFIAFFFPKFEFGGLIKIYEKRRT